MFKAESLNIHSHSFKTMHWNLSWGCILAEGSAHQSLSPGAAPPGAVRGGLEITGDPQLL